MKWGGEEFDKTIHGKRFPEATPQDVAEQRFPGRLTRAPKERLFKKTFAVRETNNDMGTHDLHIGPFPFQGLADDLKPLPFLAMSKSEPLAALVKVDRDCSSSDGVGFTDRTTGDQIPSVTKR
ncbi:MAG: hypothetical protein ACJAVK_000265 [Akkermansiaceae bacterium]|jgi:hypothetical protein